MRTIRTRSWRGLRFTGDTNCGINYQTGFDECNCQSDPNKPVIVPREVKLNASGLIGIIAGPIAMAGALLSEKDKASKAVQEALGNVRKLFPGPGTCVTGSENLPVYQGAGKWGSNPCIDTCTYITNSIRYMQAALNDWHIPRGEQNYIAAYNQVMAEYSDYYNSHCITQAPPAGGSNSSSGTGSSGSGGTQQTLGGGTNSGSSVQATSSGSGDAGASPSSQPNVSGTKIGAAVKKVPLWVWIAAGGAVALVTVVTIAKN